MKKHKKGRRGLKGFLLLTVIFLIGLGIFSYPFVSNWISKRQASRWIGDYEKDIGTLSEEEKKALWTAAVDYNNALSGQPVKDPFIPGSGVQLPQNYLEILNVSEVMAYIEIPKISVRLPVYHGVSEEVLEKGVGHMEGTSFPVGGFGTHCLLTGHTGLPAAKLFTDLTQLEIGDKFYITVLETELVYQVDQVEVIEPDGLGSLYTQPGEDYVTLITCTPYGVNSHRLLVRGTRVFQLTKTVALAGETLSAAYILAFAFSAFITLTLLCICLRDDRRKKRFRLDITGREAASG